jgi:hypothetical protein
VALDGDTALVGAPNADPPGYEEQGAAYIFKREGGNWPQRGFLIASDGEDGDGFGTAVAFLNDTALIGTPNAKVNDEPFQGAAYVFTLEGTIWSQQAKLTAADGNKLDVFGNSVALNGQMAVIGAYGKEAVSGSDNQGAVYLFTRSGDSWSQQVSLTATDGVEGDLFGYSVSLANSNVLVGTPGADIYGIENRGAVYLFVQDGDGWRQQTKLTAGNGAENNVFGVAIALGGTTVLVGTPVVEVNGNPYQGKIYFFQRPPYGIFLPAIVH